MASSSSSGGLARPKPSTIGDRKESEKKKETVSMTSISRVVPPSGCVSHYIPMSIDRYCLPFAVLQLMQQSFGVKAAGSMAAAISMLHRSQVAYANLSLDWMDYLLEKGGLANYEQAVVKKFKSCMETLRLYTLGRRAEIMAEIFSVRKKDGSREDLVKLLEEVDKKQNREALHDAAAYPDDVTAKLIREANVFQNVVSTMTVEQIGYQKMILSLGAASVVATQNNMSEKHVPAPKVRGSGMMHNILKGLASGGGSEEVDWALDMFSKTYRAMDISSGIVGGDLKANGLSSMGDREDELAGLKIHDLGNISVATPTTVMVNSLADEKGDFPLGVTEFIGKSAGAEIIKASLISKVEKSDDPDAYLLRLSDLAREKGTESDIDLVTFLDGVVKATRSFMVTKAEGQKAREDAKKVLEHMEKQIKKNQERVAKADVADDGEDGLDFLFDDIDDEEEATVAESVEEMKSSAESHLASSETANDYSASFVGEHRVVDSAAVLDKWKVDAGSLTMLVMTYNHFLERAGYPNSARKAADGSEYVLFSMDLSIEIADCVTDTMKANQFVGRALLALMQGNDMVSNIVSNQPEEVAAGYGLDRATTRMLVDAIMRSLPVHVLAPTGSIAIPSDVDEKTADMAGFTRASQISSTDNKSTYASIVSMMVLSATQEVRRGTRADTLCGVMLPPFVKEKKEEDGRISKYRPPRYMKELMAASRPSTFVSLNSINYLEMLFSASVLNDITSVYIAVEHHTNIPHICIGRLSSCALCIAVIESPPDMLHNTIGSVCEIAVGNGVKPYVHFTTFKKCCDHGSFCASVGSETRSSVSWLQGADRQVMFEHRGRFYLDVIEMAFLEMSNLLPSSFGEFSIKGNSIVSVNNRVIGSMCLMIGEMDEEWEMIDKRAREHMECKTDKRGMPVVLLSEFDQTRDGKNVPYLFGPPITGSYKIVPLTIGGCDKKTWMQILSKWMTGPLPPTFIVDLAASETEVSLEKREEVRAIVQGPTTMYQAIIPKIATQCAVVMGKIKLRYAPEHLSTSTFLASAILSSTFERIIDYGDVVASTEESYRPIPMTRGINSIVAGSSIQMCTCLSYIAFDRTPQIDVKGRILTSSGMKIDIMRALEFMRGVFLVNSKQFLFSGDDSILVPFYRHGETIMPIGIATFAFRDSDGKCHTMAQLSLGTGSHLLPWIISMVTHEMRLQGLKLSVKEQGRLRYYIYSKDDSEEKILPIVRTESINMWRKMMDSS